MKDENSVQTFWNVFCYLCGTNMEGYTHLAELYGFRCWYNDETGDVKGTNWFNEKMIDLFVWIDTTFDINDGFYIKVVEKL